jgi:hypothetical protein
LKARRIAEKVHVEVGIMGKYELVYCCGPPKKCQSLLWVGSTTSFGIIAMVGGLWATVAPPLTSWRDTDAHVKQCDETFCGAKTLSILEHRNNPASTLIHNTHIDDFNSPNSHITRRRVQNTACELTTTRAKKKWRDGRWVKPGQNKTQ